MLFDPSSLVNAITGSVGYLLAMSGHEKDYCNVVLVSGSLAVILALVLTPWFGATGAAIATALAVASQNFLSMFLYTV
jgi:O-antigen/teichoic acid export membrane protein